MSSALELALREHFCVDLFGALCTFISVSGISVTRRRAPRWRHEVDGARLSVWISEFFLCVFFWRLGTLFVPNFARVEAVCDGFGIRSVCRADVPVILRLPVIVLFRRRCRALVWGDIARATLVSGAAQCAGVSRPCVPFPGAWISRVSNTPPLVCLDIFGALFL